MPISFEDRYGIISWKRERRKPSELSLNFSITFNLEPMVKATGGKNQRTWAGYGSGIIRNYWHPLKNIYDYENGVT
jgi:hypothetical protein